MELIEDPSAAAIQIQSYKPGQLVVNQESYAHSLLLTANQLQSWPPQQITEITAAHLQLIVALEPHMVILGTGATQIFLAAPLLAIFAQRAIGVEIMSTAAACRTFNVLVAEGRKVAAGLLIR